MADEADFAQNAEEYARAQALAELKETQLALKGPARRDDGLCYWCESVEALPGGAFCSRECADDWAELNKMRLRGHA